jgi:hypothetical protein
MSPTHPDTMRNPGKLGRNPFNSPTLKVGVKTPLKARKHQDDQGSKKRQIPSATPKMRDRRLNWGASIQGVSYLIEGAFFACARILLEKLH